MSNIGEVGFGRGVNGSGGDEKIAVPGGAFYRDFGMAPHRFGRKRANGDTIA